MIDPYSTHLAPLVRAALRADGPILELGCGDYSTPVLAEIAKARGLPFTVMSSSPEWAARYRDIAHVIEVFDWASVNLPGDWGLVLLDNEQTTRDRIRHLPTLKKVTRCVVLHDLEASEAHPHWPFMIDGFASIERFTRYHPGTAILTC